ncbi:uncharacterized protein V6R79_015200 [Siganus canaliculatus]
MCDEAETAICTISEETSSTELSPATAAEMAGEDSESIGSMSSFEASGKAEKRKRTWRKLWKWAQLKSSRTNKKSPWKKFWKWANRKQPDKSGASGSEPSPSPEEHVGSDECVEKLSSSSVEVRPSILSPFAVKMVSSSPAVEVFYETVQDVCEPQSCDLETEHVDGTAASDILDSKHSPELQQSEDREEAVDSVRSASSEESESEPAPPSSESSKSVKKKSQWKRLWKWIQRPQDKSEARKPSPAPEEHVGSDECVETLSSSSDEVIPTELSPVPVKMISSSPAVEVFYETIQDVCEPQSCDLEAEQQLDSRRSISEVLSTMEPLPAPVTVLEMSLSISEPQSCDLGTEHVDGTAASNISDLKHSPELQQSEDREEAVDSVRSSSSEESSESEPPPPSAEGSKSVKKRKSQWKRLWKWIQRPQDKSEARKPSPAPEDHVGSDDGCEKLSSSSVEVRPSILSPVPEKMVSSSPAFEVFNETALDVCEPQSCDLGTEYFMTETVDVERSDKTPESIHNSSTEQPKSSSCGDLEQVHFEFVYPFKIIAPSLSPLSQDIQQEPLQVQLAALENIIKETLHRFFNRLDRNRHLSNSAYKLQTTDEFVSTISEIMNAIVGTLNSNLIKVLRHITSTNELSGHVRKWVEDTEKQLKKRLKDSFSVDFNNATGADQSDIVMSILKRAIYRRVTDEVTSVFSGVTEELRTEPIQVRADSPEIIPDAIL